MVALVDTGIVAQFAGFMLNAAPWMLLHGADHLGAFSQQQLESLSYASLSLVGRQSELLTSIWGLWLFPFAILTIKSGFLPKFLGVFLIITGTASVALA
jgi:hypothetical protein